MDLASLAARPGMLADPWAGPPRVSMEAAAPASRFALPEEKAAVVSAHPYRATGRQSAEPNGRGAAPEAPGGVGTETGAFPLSPGDFLPREQADSLAHAEGLNSWDRVAEDHPFRPMTGRDGEAPSAPAGVGAGLTTAAQSSAPAMPVNPRQTNAADAPARAAQDFPLLPGTAYNGNPPPPPGSHLTAIGYSLGQPVLDPHSFGDTWGPARSLDGRRYTASDDSAGFDNAIPNWNDIVSNRLTGDPNAGTLHGVTLAGLTAYGPAAEGCYFLDGCDNWKATNMTSVNGVPYLGVTITSYIDQRSLQTQHNASIIKSDNGDGLGLGHTWAPAHGYADDPTTMWPDTPAFSAPYFVDYGQDPDAAGDPAWPDGAAQYVYAVSTDAAVRNASNLYLGRVRRDQIGNLRAADWSFVTGFDAQGRPVWGSVDEAAPVLGVLHGDHTAGRLGWTTVEWAAPIQKYVLTEWYYPNPRSECPGDPQGSCQSTSRWVMYQADHVWGPWQSFGPEFTWAPGNPSSETEGDYFPVLPTRFTDPEVDMTVYPYQWHAWVLTTGDYWNPDMYRLTAVRLTLELIPTPPKDPAASIKTVAATVADPARLPG
jgi:hypothetical protein